MDVLRCSSMAHVIDRATAFLFAGVPFTVVEVRPNAVLIHRPAGDGYAKAETYLVTTEPRDPSIWNLATDYAINATLLEMGIEASCKSPPKCFIDEGNEGPPAMAMYAVSLLKATLDGKFPSRR